ncbi:MAG: hypothetical protein U9P14_12740, partial [Gemmatimonadota bacterium]|nr:hypothetical protein [Gemmatimonadota bacterium]
MNPAKILKVAWRDFLETVRTKTFLISVLIVPLIFIPVMLLVNHFQKKALFGPREDRHLAAISPDDELSPELEKVFASSRIIRCRGLFSFHL